MTIGGGGAGAGEAWMRFDGTRYSGNPTVEPMTDAGAQGQVLLTPR